MYCKKCGAEIREGNKFCTKCGANQQEKGTEIPTGDNVQSKAKRGLVDALLDKAIEKTTGTKTVPLSVEQMTQLISDIYIKGSSVEEKESLKKTIKGAFFRVSLLTSKDNKYTLRVSEYNIHYAPLSVRTVWIKDNEENVFYELAKDRWYKKLKRAVMECL